MVTLYIGKKLRKIHELVFNLPRVFYKYNSFASKNCIEFISNEVIAAAFVIKPTSYIIRLLALSHSKSFK